MPDCVSCSYDQAAPDALASLQYLPRCQDPIECVMNALVQCHPHQFDSSERPLGAVIQPHTLSIFGPSCLDLGSSGLGSITRPLRPRPGERAPTPAGSYSLARKLSDTWPAPNRCKVFMQRSCSIMPMLTLCRPSCRRQSPMQPKWHTLVNG